MSTPLNPLSNFQSYSYHHVLVACSNSDVVDAIVNNSDISQFDRGPGSKYDPIVLGNVGAYVVLINSMTDAEFFINDIEWGSVFSPTAAADSTYNFNAIETDGEMTVVEPMGMRFINVLSETGQALGISPPAMPFLLKTVFVGQLPNGQSETISTVRPMVFTLVDVAADFDLTGASYKMSIVGGRDGYAKHPGISHILSGQSLPLKKGQTIGEALDVMFANANIEYQRRLTIDIESQQEALKAAGPTQETYEPGVDFLPITYVVKYDTAFTTYIVADNDDSSTKNQEGGHTVAFQPEQSLLSGISRIMESSASFVRDTGKGVDVDGRNRKFTYKVTDDVKIKQDRMVVTYNVTLYELTTTPIYGDGEQGTGILPPKDNVITFDYVYTGRNIDILDFKMEMDMALAYFMTLSSSRSLRSQAEYNVATSTEDQSGNSATVAVGVTSVMQAKGIPRGPRLFLPQVTNETNKKVSALETNTARQVLASFAQMSTIGVKLKIAGNPNILETLLIPSPDAGTIETPVSLDREQDDDEVTDVFNPDWSRLPGYCKINIMMPVSSEQVGVYEEFWYTGYYRIISVRNSFNDGEFTQELELYSMPISSAISDHASTTGEAISPTATKPPPASVPETPSSTASTSDNVPSSLYSEYDDLIVEKSAKYGLDPNMMRSLIKAESDFDPNAVSGAGAAGLGQLMPSTADAIAKQQKELGVLEQPFVRNSTRDDRFDPETNVEFACYLMNQNLAIYKGNRDLALASYNAGHKIVGKYGVPPADFRTNDGSVGQTYNYVKKINKYMALAETQSPTIPAEPPGPKLDLMSSRDAFNTYKGPTQ